MDFSLAPVVSLAPIKKRRWRDNHKEEYNEQQKKYSLAHYHRNKEIVLIKKKQYYLLQKAFKEFLFQGLL